MKKLKYILLYLAFAVSLLAIQEYKSTELTTKGKFLSSGSVVLNNGKKINGRVKITFDPASREKYRSIINEEENFEFRVKVFEATYKNGEIDEKEPVYSYDEDGKINMSLQEIGDYVERKVYKNGVLYEKYSRKKINLLENLFTRKIDGLMNGPYEVYYENGNLREKGQMSSYNHSSSGNYTTYKAGKQGIITFYYENGVIKSEEEFEKGLRNGRGKFYDENGKLVREETKKIRKKDRK